MRLSRRLPGIALALLLALIAPAEVSAASKYSAIVVDAGSGQALYARHADTRRYPASLTKMMTLYLVFEALDAKRLKLDDRITASAWAAQQPPTKLGLEKGEKVKVGDAILALVTASANDVAVAVAEHLGGSESAFAQLMTKKARQIGMQRTQFRNASGLPDARQYSTARDMTVLARALLREFPHHYGYFARQEFVYQGRTHGNHNRLLEDFPGTDGIKTGYIHASGFNLVASVARDGQRLVGVVFGGRSTGSRNNHMRDLIDRGFERLATYIKPATPPLPAWKPTMHLAALPAPPTKPASDPAALDGWKVQVGAFDSYDTAERQARRAAKAVTGMLRQPQYAVETVVADSVRYYRAHLTPHDANRAEQACRVLRQRRMDCFTIPPGNEQVAGSLSEG